MKLHECLYNLPQGMWFRPVGVKYYAYCLQDGNILRIPSARGGEATFTRNSAELIGDWERINPDVIFEEMDDMYDQLKK